MFANTLLPYSDFITQRGVLAVKLKISAALAAILTLALSAQSQAENYAPKDDLYLVCGPALVLIKKANAWTKFDSALGKSLGSKDEATAIRIDINLLLPGKNATSPKVGWNSGKEAEAYADHFQAGDIYIDRTSGALMTKAKFYDPSHEDESFPCKVSSESEQIQLVQSHNAKIGDSKF
jgi:hypothetical protein